MKIVQFFAVSNIPLNCYSQADSSRGIIARDESGFCVFSEKLTQTQLMVSHGHMLKMI